MSIGQRIVAAQNRFYDRMRHRQAFEAASQPGERRDLAPLQGHKYALLTTFKRSGEGVPTPIWFGLADGRAYVNTERHIGKLKRIANDPRVTIVASNARGKPTGPVIAGRARVLGPEDDARAEAAIQSNYGLGRRVFEVAAGATGVDTVYLEISPVEAGPSPPAAEESAGP